MFSTKDVGVFIPCKFDLNLMFVVGSATKLLFRKDCILLAIFTTRWLAPSLLLQTLQHIHKSLQPDFLQGK